MTESSSVQPGFEKVLSRQWLVCEACDHEWSNHLTAERPQGNEPDCLFCGQSGQVDHVNVPSGLYPYIPAAG
jgi:hypothetical protein